jgi:chromosome condensin MukBEF complex kleisin-like MukF subunit
MTVAQRMIDERQREIAVSIKALLLMQEWRAKAEQLISAIGDAK